MSEKFEDLVVAAVKTHTPFAVNEQTVLFSYSVMT